MDYRYIQAFCEVARAKSISAAAERLNIAQSAVSRQVALLEDSLKEDLFFRGARGMRLTPKGEELFIRMAHLDNWLQSEFYGHVLPIRVGGLEGVLNLWLGPRLINAHKTALPLHLDLRQMSNEVICRSLERGEIDIGLSSCWIESEWVTSRRLYSEKIFLISKEPILPNKLESYCWIGVNKAAYLHKLAKNKMPERSIQTGSINLLLDLVRAGKGIAAVAESLIPLKGFIKTPTALSGESIYLNLPSYRKLPSHLDLFIKNFLQS